MTGVAMARQAAGQGWRVAPARASRIEAEAPALAIILAGIVAAGVGVPAWSVLAASRRGAARIALARQVAIYLAHTRLGLHYAEAGALFGRDRTTAAHACRTVEKYRGEPAFDALIERLEGAVDLCAGLLMIGWRVEHQDDRRSSCRPLDARLHGHERRTASASVPFPPTVTSRRRERGGC